MNKIIVVGGGGHAKVLMSVIKKLNIYDILGYTDINDNGNLLNFKYLGNDSVLENIIKENPGCCAALGIGTVKINDKRKNIKENLEKLGFILPPIISPFAVVNEGVSVGSGTVIYDGVVVNTGTTIGEGVILNTRCSIDHDCGIGNYVHIAPGVTLSGGITVGDNCFLGTGSCVIHSTRITNNCVIGAGAAVVKDCNEEGTYLGVPARRTK
jgi:sugar O-acyltransferase (sialic acid O-acetyltransferase NeuD family)